MKSVFSAVVILLVSQSLFAATPEEVVSQFEQNRAVRCEMTHSSHMSYCFNNICEYTSYYSCGEQTLTLKVKSVRYPDGSADESVIESSAN